MTMFRKKPVVIEAVQWEPDAWDNPFPNINAIIQWVLDGGGTARYHDEPVDGVPSDWIAIDTLEGTMKATPGDWIIRGVQGEHYPCKPDIFDATYEPVAASPAPETQ